ncbi:MAG: YggS family pyridoxal phosphate-dependent enzyme [Bacteroidota bacterium]
MAVSTFDVSDQKRVTLIQTRLEAVRARIEAAAARTGRSADEITLLAVTKTFPLGVVEAALAAGLRDFGENRVQELAEKVAHLPGAQAGNEAADAIRWHFIGGLQRNKAKTVADVADVFHALDSPRLARELNKQAAKVERVLPCFVQVNVSGEDSKSGLEPDEVGPYVDSLAAYPHLQPVGLMTLAAPARSPSDLEAVVRPQLRQLRRLADDVGRERLPYLSMGMSGDFEVAIEEGATHIRLGSVLFGARG